MSIESVLLPVFVQVLLTLGLLILLAVRRQRMFRQREMHPQDLAVRGAASMTAYARGHGVLVETGKPLLGAAQEERERRMTLAA